MENNNFEQKLFDYYDGILSEKDVDEIAAWIDSSEENRKLAERVYSLCLAADTIKIEKEVNMEKALSAVHKKIAVKNRHRLFVRLQRVAAILFIPLLAFTAYYLYHSSPAKRYDQIVEVRTTPGMTSSIILPDSTKVWLNSNTTLRYPVEFDEERNVELIGEAYFKVTKDDERKFHVNTKYMQIEVVGTEFNVDAYEYDDKLVKTTLVRGAINMNYKDSFDKIHIVKIYPGQRATMNTENRTISLEMTDPLCASSWRFGKIIMNHSPLADALRLIENRYNVQFVVKNPKLYDYKYTGQFTDQRLESVLEHFSKSSNLKFKRISDEVGSSVSGREIIEVY